MKVVLGGYLNGFLFDKSRGETMVTSHLLFVDDTPIICDAYSTHLHYLRCVLIWFEPILGLRIILGNSKIGPKGEIVHVEKLASNLGCHVLKYLGLPLGAHFKARHIWDSIQERMHKKLVGWKKLYLSKEAYSL